MATYCFRRRLSWSFLDCVGQIPRNVSIHMLSLARHLVNLTEVMVECQNFLAEDIELEIRGRRQSSKIL
jgi:hypothetical protein